MLGEDGPRIQTLVFLRVWCKNLHDCKTGHLLQSWNKYHVPALWISDFGFLTQQKKLFLQLLSPKFRIYLTIQEKEKKLLGFCDIILTLDQWFALFYLVLSLRYKHLFLERSCIAWIISHCESFFCVIVWPRYTVSDKVRILSMISCLEKISIFWVTMPSVLMCHMSV